MDSEMCKLVTPKRAKRNGHPRARWCDDIVKNAGAYWKEQTQDQDRWNSLVEGYSLQWINLA
jgi:hypothetical protein